MLLDKVFVLDKDKNEKTTEQCAQEQNITIA